MKFWLSSIGVLPEELLNVARMAESLGFYGIPLPDHAVFAKQVDSVYPYGAAPPPLGPEKIYLDPWVAFGAMAAVTTNLHFTTRVYVAGARHPLTTAKALATAERLSGGRVSLGLAAGWMAEEFTAMGESFENRGPRLDEMIDVLRKVWAGGWFEHHGTYYDFDEIHVSPAPNAPIPIYCGGESKVALRRAATRCDGWIANSNYEPEKCATIIGELNARREAAGRTGPFEILVGGIGATTVDDFRRLEDLGATSVTVAPWRTEGGVPADLWGEKDIRPSTERLAEQIIARM